MGHFTDVIHLRPDGDAPAVGDKAHPPAGGMIVEGKDALADLLCQPFRQAPPAPALPQQAVDGKRRQRRVKKAQAVLPAKGLHFEIGVDPGNVGHILTSHKCCFDGTPGKYRCQERRFLILKKLKAFLFQIFMV